MFEGFTLLLSAYLLTWPAFIGLLILGIFFEHAGARGWAVFTGIVTMLVSYFFFDVGLETIAYCAIAYVAVGVVWSFWRYKVFVDESVAKIKESGASGHRKGLMIETIAPHRNLDTITAWIIIWPFSAVENILGDIITMVQALVSDVFKGVYHKIYTNRVQGMLDEVSEKPE